MPAETWVSSHLLWAHVSAFGAGVATSLTPCVYPMIPITVSIFGAKQSQSKLTSFALATAYVMGIAVMYATLGVLAALGGWAAGSILSSAWFVVPLAVFFLLLASSMFGMWDIRLPHAISSRMALVGGQSYRGAFVMGLVGGVIIAPCTGPVLAGVLTYVATTRSVISGASLLFSYAVGIGILFWLLATFSVSLPKCGRWMGSVKSMFGLALTVAAIYYLQNVWPWLSAYRSPDRSFVVVNVALVLFGIALGALHLDYHDKTISRRLRKTVGILATTLGILGVINFLNAPAQHLPWIKDEHKAFAMAKREKKPLLIDFWATWCGPCREMETDVLNDPMVRRELSRFVLFKVDVSDDTEQARTLQAKYNTKAQLPFIVLIGHDGVVRKRLGKVDSPQKMLSALHSIQ